MKLGERVCKRVSAGRLCDADTAGAVDSFLYCYLFFQQPSFMSVNHPSLLLQRMFWSSCSLTEQQQRHLKSESHLHKNSFSLNVPGNDWILL